MELKKFKELGLSENTLNALRKKGFEEPSPIQEKTIPLLLKGEKNVIGQAQTGTGKTAAFGLPVIEKVNSEDKSIQALILAPTRELAIQVSEEMNSLKGDKNITILPIYGGQSIENQLRRLKKGVQVVVGTPGRVIDHIHRKSLKLDTLEYLILDEADEMLNMGFIDDVEEILKYTPEDRKMLLFSATMPDKIRQLAKKYMGDYAKVEVEKEQLTTHLTDQIYFEVSPSDKFEALCRIIDIEHDFYAVVFCRTKVDVDVIAGKLSDRGYDTDGLHGDISQPQREAILRKFKSRKINILVATDVAARGIDVQDLTHVINYALPQDPESYVHRIGRTGRAGKEGTAITFITPEEYRKLLFIKKITKTSIRKEKLPGIKEIIESKKSIIQNEINEILESGDFDQYVGFAQELISENEPEKVLAALLKHAFKEELDQKYYHEIRDISVNRKGRTRLFIAKGKMDNMDAKKIAHLIQSESKIDPRKLQDIRVFEKFSFVTVPFEEGEMILETFKRIKRGRRPVVERAKEK